MVDLSNGVDWMVSTNFQDLHSLYKSLCDSTNSTNYNWYKYYFDVP